MGTKSKKSSPFISYSNEKTVELTQVTLAVSTKTALNAVTKHSIGGGSLPNKTHGAGPLAYDGVTNSSGNIFSGTSRMDQARHIVVYKEAGVKMFSSANSNESLLSHIDKSKMTSCQAQIVIPLDNVLNSDGKPISHPVEDFRQLRNNYISSVKKVKTKVDIDERTKVLKVGNTSRLIKISVQDVICNNNKSKGLVMQAQFKESQAANLLEAAKLAPERSMNLPLAASLLEALSDLPAHAILDPFRKVLTSYPVSDVFLSKRQRTTRVSNTKVIYARNGLSSITKNITILEPSVAQEYVSVGQDFVKELLPLTKKCSAAYDFAIALKNGLSTLSQSRPATESKEAIQPDPSPVVSFPSEEVTRDVDQEGANG